MSGLEQLWRSAALPARTFAMGIQHVPMSSGRNSRPNGARELTIEARNPTRVGQIRRAGLRARCESDSGLFSWQKLTLRRAVDERRFACGWTRRGVARIQQITSVDPGRP